MTEARLAASYVHLLYEYLRGLGLDPHKLLGPLPSGHFVALPTWRAALDLAQALDPRPALSLRLAAGISARHFGVVGFAALACPNLFAALQRLERFHNSVYDVNPAQVELTAQGLCIEWGTARGRPGALVDETALASLVQLTRDFTGRRLAPLQVDFVNPRPLDTSPYLSFFGCPVYFEQPSTRLLLATQDLSLPLRKSDPALLALLDAQAEALLQAVSQVAAPVAAFRLSLVALIREGHTSLDALARAHHLSTRSLQRRLAEQGLSFQALLDGTRRQLAEAYLRSPDLELSEIALLLGFSEQSAFTRAFGQWTGMAPANWRKQHLRDPL
ncbi:AraC family transcriptional regulator [Roseateles albus]|uniref:AraC family transcriptional regulator ligand-binding domain-containing protein n=1 Tax=Roseateles albus TaxID=2987525 RepID=A0ABT5K9V5_9BURK|nr:AraC family transcriptional regulator [Roseateles albus]MDC8770560.1 AraC family transcriptional regulator ligand-binding domain-containing protein [Roseateles albus]